MTGYKDLEPEDISGTASSSLPRVPLEALTPHDAQDDATPVTESSMTPALRSIPRTDPPRTFMSARELMRIFSSAPGTLNAPGWDPSAIDALSATPAEYADIFLLIRTGLWCMLSAPL